MKILLITSTDSRHNFFCQNFVKEFPNDEIRIIMQEKPVKNFTQRIKKRLSRDFFRWTRKYIYDFLFSSYVRRFYEEKSACESTFFGDYDNWVKVHCPEKLIIYLNKNQSLNSKRVVKAIRNYHPDLIFVMGSGIVGKRIINAAKMYAINLHTGLSPYYRGGFTNLWPILDGRAAFCGSTVHLLSHKIDGGDIIAHATPEIEYTDDYSSINCKAIVCGVDVMTKLIKKIQSGIDVTMYTQEDIGVEMKSYNLTGYELRKYYTNYANTVSNFCSNKLDYPEDRPSLITL